MNIQFQVEEMNGYLAVRFTGAGDTEEAWRQFGQIAEYCKRTNKNKLLIDFTGANVKISFADRYFLGDNARIFAQYRLTVAAVERPERIDPKKFGELVAQNRGVNVRVFSDTQAAKEWLSHHPHQSGIDVHQEIS